MKPMHVWHMHVCITHIAYGFTLGLNGNISIKIDIPNLNLLQLASRSMLAA